jgi:hypothetical protein
MTFQTVPFNVTGGTHQNMSRPLSVQRTVNMYMLLDESGKEAFTLHSFPGQKLMSVSDGQFDRGAHRMNEKLYRVVDDALYYVDSAGVHFKKGTLTGAGHCIFADDGENLVIVTDKVCQFNATTNAFSEITDVNIVGAISVTFINNQFIYTKPDLSVVSDVGLPDKASGLNQIAAESNPDKLVRDYAFNQTIYRFGTHTCELWYNSGVGSPPIDRIEGSSFSVGLSAIHSLVNTDNALYWLGDDKSIYRTQGRQEQKISDAGLSSTIESMTKSDDAIGNAFTMRGLDFYMITFPTAGRTFVLNESLGVNGWFELASTNLSTAYSGTTIIDCYNKNYVMSGNKLLTLEYNEYTQDSDTMIRQRVTSSVNGNMIGIKGQRMKMSRMELICETGVGLMTGQGENPRLLIEYSIDGGKSFRHGGWVRLGRLGESTLRAEFWKMISFTDLIFRISMSDPVPLTIYSAAIDIKAAGR